MFDLIEELKNTKNVNLFHSIVSSLEDINKNLIESEDNSLNLLHIFIGFEETEFSLKCIKYLLSVPGININALAKINGTLGISGAHIAIDWRHYEVLKVLIDKQIDLFICDSYGLSANDYAIEKDDKKGQNIIEEALHNYLNSTSNRSDVSEDNNAINIKVKTKTRLDYSLNQLKDSFNSEPIPPKETDFQKTVEYFDENQNLLNSEDRSENIAEDKNGDTLTSNISYEKTESVKSCCSDRTEIYVYNDRDHNVVLIEERFENGCPNSLIHHSSDDKQNISKGSATQSSDDQLCKEIQLMSETEIFSQLIAMGDSPGPILNSTKKFYQKRLMNLRKGTPSPSKKVLALPDHSLELNLLLENKFPFEETLKLEKHFIDFFEKKDLKQNNFIYLLIDPNISQNIPLQANTNQIVVNSCAQIDTNLFMKFIKSIFYVGKGQGNRVYQHFYEAIKTKNNQQMCPKVKRIHEIWSSDKGVTSLHCFHDISSTEALAREAIIIEALNLSNLTNQVNGQYIRGLKWNERKRRLFGSYLLFKSFGIYVLTGERQIRRPHHKKTTT